MSERDTLVVVQCYQGDADQLPILLPQWQHHGYPVLILSPEDSPVVIEAEGVECRSAGRVGWAGRHTLDRQLAHFRIMAEYPQRYLLMHDADSVILSPELPDYLYERGDCLFSNEVDSLEFLTRWAGSERDALRRTFVGRGSQCDFTDGHPCVFNPATPAPDPAAAYAFQSLVLQPPYFGTQTVIQKLLAASDAARETDYFPIEFIDWYWAAMTRESGIDHANFRDGISYPTADPTEVTHVERLIRHRGVKVIHSVKTQEAIDRFAAAHIQWRETHE